MFESRPKLTPLEKQYRYSSIAALDWQEQVMEEEKYLRAMAYRASPEWYYVRDIVRSKWEQANDQHMMSIKQEA